MLYITSKSRGKVSILDSDDWVEETVSTKEFEYFKSLGMDFSDGEEIITPTALKLKAMGVLKNIGVDNGYLYNLVVSDSNIRINLSDICRGFGAEFMTGIEGIKYLYADDRFVVEDEHYVKNFLYLDLSMCSQKGADRIIQSLNKTSNVFITFAVSSACYIKYLIKWIYLLELTGEEDFLDIYRRSVSSVKARFVPALIKKIAYLMKLIDSGDILLRKKYATPTYYYIDAYQEDGSSHLGAVVNNIINEEEFFCSLSSELSDKVMALRYKLQDKVE